MTTRAHLSWWGWTVLAGAAAAAAVAWSNSQPADWLWIAFGAGVGLVIGMIIHLPFILFNFERRDP